MRRSIIWTTGMLIAVVVSACGSAATPPIPSEKVALESFAAAFRSSAPRADKSSDPGPPIASETDAPPEVGLFAHANAPAPGGVFTPSNEWAGWVDVKTFVQVWAGDQPELGGGGLIMVMRRPGLGDGLHLDPDAEPTQTFVPPPVKGGPLTITAVRKGLLVISNPKGDEFLFDPADGTFMTPTS
jgi:hypothetical protein